MNGPRYTFRGNTLQEAYARMKQKLGNHFEVEETRSVRADGWMGWLGKRAYEVVARPLPVPRAVVPSKPAPAVQSAASSVSPERLKFLEDVVRDAQRRMMGSAPATTPESEKKPGKQNPSTASPSTPSEARSLPEKNVAEAGQIFSARIGDQIEAENRLNRISAADTGTIPGGPAHARIPQAPSIPVTASAAAPALVPFPRRETEELPDLQRELRELREMVQALWLEHPSSDVPPAAARWYRMLTQTGMSRRTAAALIRLATERMDPRVIHDSRVFVERLRMVARKLVRVTGGIRPEPGKTHVVALCGTTGVGKTTTVAKLAARFALQEHLNVALLTLDTYRIAATEQLRIYADIIGVPMKIASAPDQVADMLASFGRRDLILVDTAGSSQFNLEQLRDLQALLAATRPNETMLVMAANTPVEDLRVVAARFSALSPTSLIFTKLDETRRFGGMLNFLLESPLPLAYCCTGQNVPDDIETASPGLVASLITEGNSSRE